MSEDSARWRWHLRIDIIGFEDMASPIARIVAVARRGKRARVQAPQSVLCHSASAARVVCPDVSARARKNTRALPSHPSPGGALQPACARSHLGLRGTRGTGPGCSIVRGSAARSARWRGSVGPRSPACAAAGAGRSGRQRRGPRGGEGGRRAGKRGARGADLVVDGGRALVHDRRGQVVRGVAPRRRRGRGEPGPALEAARGDRTVRPGRGIRCASPASAHTTSALRACALPGAHGAPARVSAPHTAPRANARARARAHARTHSRASAPVRHDVGDRRGCLGWGWRYLEAPQSTTTVSLWSTGSNAVL